jgi:hypothetical protein
MITGMARQIRIIELTLGPESRAAIFERSAIGLGAAPWKTVLVTRATASGKRELSTPKPKPDANPSMKRTLYGLT